nr:DUF1615 family protein [Pseudoxanthomonas spadix]
MRHRSGHGRARLLPGIVPESPRITRPLTSAWLARPVNARWQRCMKR